MNIDSLARLIEGADVSTLRNVAVDLLPLIGFDEASFSDGPYDGGLDFVVRTQRVNGLKIGFQLSVEKKWKEKILADAKKAKAKHAVNTLYFITTRRVPEGSWSAVRTEVAKSTGVNLFKFDSQAIASEFIRANQVKGLLGRFGISLDHKPSNEKFLSPQNEAVAALVIFGTDARDFREGMVDSMMKAFLAREADGLARPELISAVIDGMGLGEAHGAMINSHIDRMLQAGTLVSVEKVLSLEPSELATFKGLSEASQFELDSLRAEVSQLLKDSDGFSSEVQDLILANLLGLTKALMSNVYQLNQSLAARDQIYEVILNALASKVGEEAALAKFADLSRVVAGSQFGKRVASARLYQELLETGSTSLASALGGARGLAVYLDTSVFIPMLCAVLFDPGMDRFGKSGGDLFNLLREHEFTAILPMGYLEEVGAHLVSACRDYRHLMERDIDVIRSTNAFVSHYSSLRHRSGHSELSFENYVSVFGLRLSSLPAVIADDDFFRLRDKGATEIRKIARRYGVQINECEAKFTKKIERRIRAIDDNASTPRPAILVAHDATVVAFLEEQALRTDDVSILCTWDRIHAELNPDGGGGYFVMSPVSLIDFLSVAKRDGERARVTSLDNFVDSLTESQIVLSARIWDAVARISGSELSDASVISSAKRFREEYLTGKGALGLVSEEEIAKSWVAWRKSGQH